MKTIIFDIDGTLTDMSPVEGSLTWKKDKPKLEKYPLVKWIVQNKNKYRFMYATGGKKDETIYAVKNLGIIKFFDLQNSISKETCRFSKKTGIPFKKIKKKFPDCFLITDSDKDCQGAKIAKIPFLQIKPRKNYENLATLFN